VATPLQMLLMAAGASDASWTPANLGASLLAWYDADDTSTLLVSGVPVTNGNTPTDGWDDKSGNGHDTTTSDLPTWHSAVLNGKGVMRFDGTNDGFFINSAFMYTNATIEIWIVAKSDESGTGALISEGNGTSGAQVYRVYDDDTNNDYVFQYTNASNVDRFVNTQNRSTNDWDLIIATDYGAATGTNLEVVDLDAGTTAAYTRDGGTWNRFSIAYSLRSTAGTFFDGDIAEIVVVSAALTGADRTNMTAYMNTKFGKSWTPA
jgi:hypothetical protein